MTRLPTRHAFLTSLGTSHLDDDVLAIAGLLDEVHATAAQPMLQALVLCDVFRHCASFDRRRREAPSPFTQPWQPPQVVLPDAPRTRQRSGNVQMIRRSAPLGRERSGDVLPVFTQNPSSPQSTFVRQRKLEEVERAVQADLCDILRCTPNVLPSYIEERFSIGMTGHGYRVDEARNDTRHRLDEAQRAERRVAFHGGMAFMVRSEGNLVREVPADTSDYISTGRDGKHRRYCWGYVFSGGSLYIENHAKMETGGHQFFHSSYLDGAPVDCAGDISFLAGRLTSISTLSGHYQPESRRLVPVIRMLQRKGVDLSSTRVALFGDDSLSELSTMDPAHIADPSQSPLLRTVAEFLSEEESRPNIQPRVIPGFFARS